MPDPGHPNGISDQYSFVDPTTDLMYPQGIASKGGIGNNGGANDERRFGQFGLKFDF